jgi:hypothetical protein
VYGKQAQFLAVPCRRVASRKMTPKSGWEAWEELFVASWEKDTQEESDADATND